MNKQELIELKEGLTRCFKTLHYTVGILSMFIVFETFWVGIFIMVTNLFPSFTLCFIFVSFFCVCLTLWGAITFFIKIKKLKEQSKINKTGGNKKWQS